jgi:hypothetical protein
VPDNQRPDDMQTVQQASAAPSKRGRGRPRGSTRASQNTRDIRTYSSTQ